MPKTKNWGATPQDWINFDLAYGLGKDMLPVVSNLDAQISEHSNMKGVGKTPSVYNKSGYVVGVAGWTARDATEEDLEEWSEQPDYGICVQTRELRALDIDVDDKAKSQEIVDFINRKFQKVLPMRFRQNSGKCVLAFRLPGKIGKRVVKVEGGIVEFLGNGQQFVVAGTHTSGARYEWDMGETYGFPMLSTEDFEAVWSAIKEEFAIDDEISGGNLYRKDGDHKKVHDPNVEFLDVLGEGKDGQLYITCPFEHEHSSDTGVAQTCYFPKGTRGYEQGHFHCLHASCQKRTDGDFLDALGVTAAKFETLPAEVDEDTGEELKPLPNLHRDNKGQPLGNVDNVCMYLSRPDLCGFHIAFDTFKDEMLVAENQKGERVWRDVVDKDYTSLQRMFDRAGFKTVSRENVRNSVELVAMDHQFDSAQIWLKSLEWDGVPRIDRFVTDCFGAEDNDFSTAVSRYLWSALAGRVMVPGVKADMVPILVGDQGLRKSSAVAAIAPDEELFTEIAFNESDDNLARRTRGCVIVEAAELNGLHSRELESIKAFVTRRIEDWVPKYKERNKKYARRFIVVGTSNSDDFLADATGNRRWLPFKITQCDTDLIAEQRDQLWAEAAVLFKEKGICFEDAERLGQEEVRKFTMVDAWEAIIDGWLHTAAGFDSEKPVFSKNLTTQRIMVDALGVDRAQINRANEFRVASIMRSLGFERVRTQVNGARVRSWTKTIDPVEDLI